MVKPARYGAKLNIERLGKLENGSKTLQSIHRPRGVTVRRVFPPQSAGVVAIRLKRSQYSPSVPNGWSLAAESGALDWALPRSNYLLRKPTGHDFNVSRPDRNRSHSLKSAIFDPYLYTGGSPEQF